MFTPSADDTQASGGAPAAAPAPAKAAEPQTAEQVVTEWFNSVIQDSEVSRNVGIYNVVREATEELKRRLAGFAAAK